VAHGLGVRSAPETWAHEGWVHEKRKQEGRVQEEAGVASSPGLVRPAGRRAASSMPMRRPNWGSAVA
jgi:hypothetical protein